mmetsp:Transcript_10950/g.23160  ORF Transcript_10950/g.23160 Transcript_10950/m.23160 type:complete len:216 (-) Transcript_10950:101-748(-)
MPPSSQPDTSPWPASSNAAERTRLVCPLSVRQSSVSTAPPLREMFQTRTSPLMRDPASRLPWRFQDTPTAPAPPVSTVAMHSKECPSQSLTHEPPVSCPSQQAVASVPPSGLKAIAYQLPVCPSILPIAWPSEMPHIRPHPSPPTVANLGVSGENEAPKTHPECPVLRSAAAASIALVVSQRRAVPSPDAVQTVGAGLGESSGAGSGHVSQAMVV